MSWLGRAGRQSFCTAGSSLGPICHICLIFDYFPVFEHNHKSVLSYIYITMSPVSLHLLDVTGPLRLECVNELSSGWAEDR